MKRRKEEKDNSENKRIFTIFNYFPKKVIVNTRTTKIVKKILHV